MEPSTTLAARATFGDPPKYPIDSVDNALQLLTLFLHHDRIRVKDAAEQLGVAAGTAHRLLTMLQYRGYVSQDPVTKIYLPGSMLLSIGLQAANRMELRKVARPFLERLNGELDETIQLATLHHQDVFFVDAVESTKVLKVGSRAGTLRPAHCTSVGKALLAELSREQVIELYPDDRLPKATTASISRRGRLLRELDEVRARGYAVNLGELEDGIGSVAAPVRDRRGRAVAALGAGAPMSRLDDRRLRVLADAVVHAASELGAALSQ